MNIAPSHLPPLPPSVAAAAVAAASAIEITRAKQRSGVGNKKAKPTNMTLIVERRLGQATERARQMAAVILDVLGGNRTPSEAARTLGLSVARYYVIELRAILGLVDGCEAGPRRGPPPDLERQVKNLELENRRLNQAVLRQQALVRNTQRGLGIGAPRPSAPESGKTGKGRKPRRPSIRALRQARRVAGASPSSLIGPAEPSSAASVSTTSQMTSPPFPHSLSSDQRGG